MKRTKAFTHVSKNGLLVCVLTITEGLTALNYINPINGTPIEDADEIDKTSLKDAVEWANKVCYLKNTHLIKY